VIAATNRDLEAEVRAGRFREDLFFRLDVLRIELPPLRERPEDIPLLAAGLLEQIARTYARPAPGISPEAMQRLLAFGYPGNVRQLANILERAVALADGPTLEVAQLPQSVAAAVERATERGAPASPEAPFPEQGVDLEALVDAFERRWIERALQHAGGVKTRAAELLGLSFRQFRYKLSKHDRRAGDGTAEETP
jgi:two-component system response regulator PilR (NtrC family)